MANNNILIVHHTDADGHCAAAIVRYELTNPMQNVAYYAYNYDSEIQKMNIKEDSIVYLVDICMNEHVEKFINECLERGCNIVHIDHHKDSVTYYNEHSEDELGWVHFVHDEHDERNGAISGTLLTFIYCTMKPEDRKHPMDVDFDLTDLRDHMIFNGDMDNEYRVPFIVRLIDDHDVWRHKINESKPFSYAYKRLPKEMTDPAEDDFWECIYNDNHRILFTSIKEGERLLEEEKEQNEILRGIGGFETDIFGVSCYCLNNLKAGSDQFGDEYLTHDCVCRFAYNGKGWTYSLYSDNKTDCSEIARRYGGGGHEGAAGFKLDYCIFGNEPPKKSFWQKLKALFIK